MFKTVWDKLKVILDWLTVFQSVYNYEVKQSNWFPYVTISPATTSEEIYDTVNDIINISYSVRIYAQNKSISTQEDNIRTLVDTVLQNLREDFTLTWSCLNVKLNIDWGYTDDEQPVRVVDITAKYLVLNSYQ